MNAIEIRNLYKKYDQIQAVNGITLEIRKGEVFGLLGPNGAGKTTILNIVQGIIEADSGSVSVLNMNYRNSASAIRQKTGIQLQFSAFIPKLRVGEQLSAFSHLYGIRPDRRKIIEMLASAGLADKVNAWPYTLSGGQKQVLSLLIVLLHDPEIIFLDEPTTGLDVHSRHALWEKIRELHREGKTILLTTHDIEEAEQLCERTGIIDRGRLVAVGSPAELIKSAGKKTLVTVSSGLNGYRIAKCCKAVASADCADGQLHILTGDVIATLSDLFRVAGNANTYLGNLHIKRPGLEDVFLDLTGHSIGNPGNKLQEGVKDE
ncbi:MAG: ABC transporter ATP-binding protein [Spirochaetales bacterium]|nr:ABC transporter ATP-binding protein [Spirochaetales bacterium]